MKKVIIIISYYNRVDLLLKSLDSFKKSAYRNFEVIIVDDGSEFPVEQWIYTIEDYARVFNYSFKIDVIRIPREEKKWNIYLIPHNIGIKKAIEKGADIIMLQNAESRHMGDVISYAANNTTNENYLSFGCFSLSKESSELHNLDDKIKDIIAANNRCAVDSDHDSWYNHPLYRGMAYDFCCSITVENIIKLNGYDERYAEGVGYCDDDFVMRIRRLGLKVEIPIDPFVVHQWHPSSGQTPDFERKIILNRELYSKIAKEETGFRATHLYTSDL